MQFDEVVGCTDQSPFAAHIIQPSPGELVTSHHRVFDLSVDWFDDALAAGIEFLSAFGT